jgi:hypothetical protein
MRYRSGPGNADAIGGGAVLYSAAGKSVTITDAPKRDANSNPTTAAVPRPVDGVRFQPGATLTNTGEKGNLAVTQGSILLPEDDPIGPGATVEVPGHGKFHMVGEPRRVESEISGRCFGLLVELVKVGTKRGS